MAEETLDLRKLSKPDAYRQLQEQQLAILEGIRDPIAAMSTLSCLVHHAFAHLWTGFYRVVKPEELLRVGPYQGTLGCLEIRFGKGVCGTAAAQRKPVIVPDVERFPGHITCDGRAKSEIVLPVFDHGGTLIAVFDVDSDRYAAFDEDDRAGLERLLSWFQSAAAAG